MLGEMEYFLDDYAGFNTVRMALPLAVNGRTRRVFFRAGK